MAGEKKNQHYVPQCYLENWATPHNSDRVYVFDKNTHKSFLTNIRNIAAERYFYDIDFKKFFTEKDYLNLGISESDIKEFNNEQLIEDYLSECVEGQLKTFLNNKINRISQMNSWELNNCYFVTESEKIDFSFHLAMQMIRVKAVRKKIEDISDVLEQMLTDAGASADTIKRYTSSNPSELSIVQGKMLIDSEDIACVIKAFATKTWILLVNKTDQPFVTSDNPIARIPHAKHPFEPKTGISSEGVEILFPLSPNMVLSMFDGNYHSHLLTYDRKIIVFDDVESVNSANVEIGMNSERWVISQNNDFSVVKEAIDMYKLVSVPPVELHYNGKKYTPRNSDSNDDK